MAVTSKAVPFLNHHPNLDKGPPTSPGCDINFIVAYDRLTATFGKTGKEFETVRKVCKVTARRRPSVLQIDRFEESLYWLLSAATLIYLDSEKMEKKEIKGLTRTTVFTKIAVERDCQTLEAFGSRVQFLIQRRISRFSSMCEQRNDPAGRLCANA